MTKWLEGSADERPDMTPGNPVPGQVRGVWKRCARELAACWHDESASDERAAQHLARQYDAVIRQLPLASAGHLLTTLAVVVIFWTQINHALLLTWVTGLGAVCVGNHQLARWHRQRPVKVTRTVVWSLAADLGLCALLYSLMIVHLFGVTGAEERLLLAAVTAALIAIGAWLLACLPQVACAWVLVACSGIAIGLTAGHGRTYLTLVGLLLWYGVVLTAAVLVTSRIFLNALKGEAKLERQREVIGLLLHDFEEHASDWLWETDRAGRLRHVSVRLAQAMQAAPETLQGRPFVDLIVSLCDPRTPQDRQMLQRLRDCLASEAAFSDVVVPVRPDGWTRWWSLTAKPLLDSSAVHQGWRGVGSDVTDRRRRELELARLASIDTLTGLANRHHFNALTATHFVGDTVSPCTLFLLDLDGFKTVNDSLGHAAGDQLLQDVARRLLHVIEPESLLARLGGDEFALFHPAGLSKPEAEQYGTRLQAALEKPWWIEEHRVDVRVSIGVASAPADAANADDLLKASDMALYAAKGISRRALRFFDREMHRQAHNKLTLLGDMREGLRRGEFSVVYQPQIDLTTGHLAGFEALVRWHHPERGLVLPADFVSLAEESGFIVPLGVWVLDQACADAASWPSEFRLAVNVSAAQLARSDVQQAVNRALRASGLDSRRLELELTESSFVHRSEATLSILHALRQQGIGIALDDFGTGYSSLACLQHLPLDKLKIDRSFVQTLHEAEDDSALSLARTVAQLAQAMGFQTTAEGIETEQQRDLLRSMGCTFGQGYFFAHPLDATETLAFINARSIWVAEAHA